MMMASAHPCIMYNIKTGLQVLDMICTDKKQHVLHAFALVVHGILSLLTVKGSSSRTACCICPGVPVFDQKV